MSTHKNARYDRQIYQLVVVQCCPVYCLYRYLTPEGWNFILNALDNLTELISMCKYNCHSFRYTRIGTCECRADLTVRCPYSAILCRSKGMPA